MAAYRASCGKCGGRRIDNQIGLEATPDEYVARLVGVFREVRRVLRDDGTLWLNLGDSYARQGGAGVGGSFDAERPGWHPRTWREAQAPPAGVKEKDLLGIPWMVAEALRDPYSTGRIRDERDRIWLAAMIDAEGCIYIHKRKAGKPNGQGYERKNDSYGSGLEVSNTNRRIVERCLEIAQAGSICEQTEGRRQTLYRWNLRTNECRDILREVYPYLVAKQHEARLACGVPSSGPKAEAAWEALKAIHNGGERDVDFPVPLTMFEPGYYLRSDIIWNKCNPMPESVTDRPTKAHEYLFLLSKSRSYFYDAEAIREDNEHPDRSGTNPRLAISTQPGNTFQGRNGRAIESNPDGRNKRSVWTVPTQPFPGAHFAVFPPKLIEPCVLAGSRPDDAVLDPFSGAGTTGVVACRHDRDYIGIELNPEYAEMSRQRIRDDGPLLNVPSERVA